MGATDNKPDWLGGHPKSPITPGTQGDEKNQQPGNLDCILGGGMAYFLCYFHVLTLMSPRYAMGYVLEGKGVLRPTRLARLVGIPMATGHMC